MGLRVLTPREASIFACLTDTNPQITIMGLATRLAYHLLGAPPPTDEPEPESIACPRVRTPHAITT